MTESDRIPRWPAMEIAERTVQYSPSSMLDGPLDPYLDKYASRSADARAAAPSIITLEYGGRAANTIDIVVPTNPSTATGHSSDHALAPLHVFIHGGYWQQLSKNESLFLALPCLNRGQALAAVDYTLAPEASLDEIVDECCAAVSALRNAADAGTLPVDSNQITVSGSSAGAHLTAMVACRLPIELRPAAVVLVSGIYDLEPLVSTYVNDTVGLDVAAAHRNSPGRCDLAGFPPTVIAWGENETDEFKRQSHWFADLIMQAGGTVAEAEVAGRNHFDVVFDIVPDLTNLIPKPT